MWNPRPAQDRPALAASLVLVTLSLLAAGCSRPDPVPVAYVAVAGNNHVRVVDLDSGETLRKIYAGAGPWRLALSPDGERLWAQHWYSGTTAVIGLDDHEIEELLPYRGPGTVDGGELLTFDWPDATLYRLDGDTLEVREERATGVKEVYDLAPGPEGQGLLLAQYDPVSRGPVPRYGYVVSYDHRTEEAEDATPLSHPTGASPVDVLAVPGQPFVLTADRDTNGITLLNALGDRRELAVCPAPRRIALSPDAARLAVVCWEEAGRHLSRVVVLDADFAARPWPALEKRSETSLAAGLVAVAFGPDGRHLYAVDRPGGRLLVLEVETLAVARELPVGDEPLDVAVATLTPRAHERLVAGEGEGRRLLRQALERGRQEGTAIRDVSWTETISWLEAPPEEEGEGDGEAEAAEPIVRSRTLQVALRTPDAMRTETEEGGVRLAAGGHTVSLDRDGRFWVTPRQDLAAVVYLLPALPVDDAIRRLAGDVPGSPFLRTGIAVDRVAEVEEDGARSWVIGADPDGERVAQLWIDTETGRPTHLVEQFPVFGGSPHGGGGAPEIAEVKLYDFEAVDGRFPLPTRLERVVEGEWLQQVELAGVQLDRALPDDAFDPALLGGATPGPLFRSTVRPAAADGRPGRPVPVDFPAGPIASPLAPHAPYSSSPPTSGPYLPFAAEWGVHPVPVPLPLQVHTLLDGGVALLYRCPGGCPELVERLGEVARERDFVLVAPYPWMDTRVALAAWGRLETLDGFDEVRVKAFIDAWAGRDHHGENPRPSSAPAH